MGNSPVNFTDPSGLVANWAKGTALTGVNAVTDLLTGGFGQRATQAINSGELGEALLYTGFGMAFGAMNVLTAVPGTVAKGAGIIANSARGLASEARVLQELGLAKNTQVVSTAEGRAIPDALTNSLSVEIKDAASVSRTLQVRVETEAARASGRESILITGKNTCVSGPCARSFDQVIRRIDLGPR